MSTASQRDNPWDGSEVAVIGMAGRFPGANNVDAFWRNLCDGVESITTFNDEQLRLAGEEAELLANPNYVRARSILEGVDQFDASFFGFNPREAEMLDPQQRLMLQCAWEALENAGYDTEQFRGVAGLFAGTSFSNYLVHNLYKNRPLMELFGDFESTLSNVQDSLATRVGYKLNLKGACCSVQTFCSTSLVAVHLASQSLLNYETDLAMAGGVTVYVPQQSGYLYQPGGISSPDGHCRTFDAKAQGTVFGNGVALVVLKRLEDALEQGDTIHAVIRGSAINNDGSTKVSYTAPGVVGQTEAIIEAHSVAGVDPATIGYVETHGTATTLGDPIEVAALTKAFRHGTDKTGFCALGSVKTNVGHLDAAAGVTGLIKTILMLNHKQLVPSLHYHTANPQIDFDASPFYVNTESTPWPASHDGTPRRAGVSAFGIGGTNAHIVLEEPPPPKVEVGVACGSPQLLILSGKTESAVNAMAKRLAQHLRAQPGPTLADVAHTLRVGRRAFGHRRMLVCQDTADAIQALEQAASNRLIGCDQPQRDTPVVFVAAGDTIDPKAVDQLDRVEPAFKEAIDQCAEAFDGQTGGDLRSLLRSGSTDDPAAQRVVRFATLYATARMWIDRGITPSAWIGHEVGWLVAGTLAGVFDPNNAVAIARDAEHALGVQPQTPKQPIAGATTDPAHWASYLDHPAQTPQAAAELTGTDQPVTLAIEPADPTTLLDQIGRLWLSGATLDWSRFDRHTNCRRVPLPTYPFESKRYWVDPLPEEQVKTATAQDLLQKIDNQDLWLYQPIWKSATPARLLGAVPIDVPRRWMIMLDAVGLGGAIADRLETHGHTVVRVDIGDRFEAVGPNAYRMRPGQREDYLELIQDLADQDKLPDTLVHAWSVNEPTQTNNDARFAETQERGFYSLMHLTQAIDRSGVRGPFQLKVLSTQMQDVLGGETIDPGKATLGAMCKVIPQEHGQMTCASIDVDVSQVQWSDEQIDVLIDELGLEEPGLTIAYRRHRRWTQTFELLGARNASIGTGKLRYGGVYLITGGLGGVGFALAAYLAKHAQAKLVLIGRTPMPAADQYDEYRRLHDDHDPVSQRIQRVQQLQALGAQVLTMTADTTNETQMDACVQETRTRFGVLHGVIHAAGVLSPDTFRPVTELDRSACQKQFAPKVQGLHVLERVLAGQTLDYCLLTSSLSSVLGGLGYAAYAAANLYMDAFVRSRWGDGLNWLSVNWDQWQSEDQTDAQAQASAGLAKLAMTVDEGAAVFGKLVPMAGVLPQVVVSTGGLGLRTELWVKLKLLRQDKGSVGAHGAAKPTLHPRPAELEASYEAPTSPMQQTLAEIWQDVLGIDRVGIMDNFFDVGGHSLASLQVIAKLEEKTGLRINIEDFIFQTLGQLAALCEQKLQEQEATPKPKGKWFGSRKGAVTS